MVSLLFISTVFPPFLWSSLFFQAHAPLAPVRFRLGAPLLHTCQVARQVARCLVIVRNPWNRQWFDRLKVDSKLPQKSGYPLVIKRGWLENPLFSWLQLEVFLVFLSRNGGFSTCRVWWPEGKRCFYSDNRLAKPTPCSGPAVSFAFKGSRVGAAEKLTWHIWYKKRPSPAWWGKSSIQNSLSNCPLVN